MSIEFVCQVCGRELKADERAIGRKVRCPDCAILLIIPDPAAAEEEQQADAGGNDEVIGSRDNRLPRIKPEEDIGATAPMEIEEVQALEPMPSAPEPPRSGKKRRGEKKRLQPAERGTERRGPEPKRVELPPSPVHPSIAPSEASHNGRDTGHDYGPLLPAPNPHAEDLIDMTAMVDIVFFLLIFFLVTSLQALESVMNLPTPQSGEPGVSTGKSVAELENDPNFITVRIEDDD